MADRDTFLSTVRSALDVVAGRTVEPEPSTAFFATPEAVSSEADAILERAEAGDPELLDRLAASAAAVGWQVERCGSAEEAVQAVVEICASGDVKTALRSAHEVFEHTPVDGPLSAAGTVVTLAARETGLEGDADASARASLRSDAFRVDAGITGVDYAVAETGTVVINPRAGVPRLMSLAPPRHIAIVESHQVLPSLDELFSVARSQHVAGGHRGMINLISGPSRTADIEGQIVNGIHGPLHAHLIIVA